MRILIIGGTGFIGPHVVLRLVEMEHGITLFHRGQTKADLPSSIKHILGDRKKLPDFEAQFKQLAPDVVLDMFPLAKQDALAVVSTFKDIAPRAVAVSSQDVYRAYGKAIHKESGPADPVPLNEDAPLRGSLYPYRDETPRDENDPNRWLDDYDKIPVERTLMSERGLAGTILRLPMVFGPGDRQHRLFKYVKRMYDNRHAILLDEGLATWRSTRGYVENVALAIALAVTDEHSTGRIYNVGESEAYTMVEWVVEIGKVVGWGGEVAIVPKDTLPAHLLSGVNTDQDLVVDTTRIREELGYREPVPLEEALKKTIEWERAHPPSNIDPQMFDYETEDKILAELKSKNN